jgi:hypothetical protein
VEDRLRRSAKTRGKGPSTEADVDNLEQHAL